MVKIIHMCGLMSDVCSNVLESCLTVGIICLFMDQVSYIFKVFIYL
jgi:hypothetical protein